MEIEFNYNSLASLIAAAEKSGLPVSRLVLMQQAEQMEQSEDEIYRHMEETYRVMASCIEPGCAPDLRSTSGLTGGSAYKMSQVSKSGKSLTGSLLSGALYRALAVSELNASMGRIVAAPTAGSCGILPAALLTMQEEREIPERDCVMALFTASAVGIVIANNASLAGAQGGCQAECGSAAAMAAAAVTELAGGTPAMISHAVAIALKNILGLVCDPVAGGNPLHQAQCLRCGRGLRGRRAGPGRDRERHPRRRGHLGHEKGGRHHAHRSQGDGRGRPGRHPHRAQAPRAGIRHRGGRPDRRLRGLRRLPLPVSPIRVENPDARNLNPLFQSTQLQLMRNDKRQGITDVPAAPWGFHTPSKTPPCESPRRW